MPSPADAMDYSVTFARHFARLVWLLIHEPGNVDEQKAALRALVTVSKDGRVTLAANGQELTANAQILSAAHAGVGDVVDQMTSHGLQTLEIDPGGVPGDLLGVARILAGTPAMGDGGAAADAKRVALGAKTVRFTLRPRPSQEKALPDLEFGEVLEDPLETARQRATPRAASQTPTSTAAVSEAGGMFEQFAAARAPTSTHEELLKRLDDTMAPAAATRLLDDLVTLTEGAARDGKPALVALIFSRIVKREPFVQEFEVKRAFVMAVRRLAKPMVLRAVAMQLPRAPETRADSMAVLVRTGEDGADALVEQLAAAAGLHDRRVYFDALLELQAGIPTLIHMLGDARWFVARNAAELLGEMQAKEAEQPLMGLLKHDDDRVRRSATGALMKLGTPRALQAIQDALKDSAPQMRMQAAAALAARKDVRTAATLLRALDDERDDEVQAAFMYALGKLATVDAVQRLVRMAEPERGLFKKKPSALRVAAVQGLSEARTPEAMEMLRTLQGDKDSDVSESARFALGRISRQTQAMERVD